MTVPAIGGLLAARIRAIKLLAFDFDGVMTDNAVWVFEDGREAVRCSRSDGVGLRRLEAVGVEPIIISTEVNTVVSARAKKLKVACKQNVEDKLKLLDELIAERGLTREEVGFVGNDYNDATCLAAVGLPVVVADGHPEVIALALYRTHRTGGHGAVREVCDLIAMVRNADDKR